MTFRLRRLFAVSATAVVAVAFGHHATEADLGSTRSAVSAETTSSEVAVAIPDDVDAVALLAQLRAKHQRLIVPAKTTDQLSDDSAPYYETALPDGHEVTISARADNSAGATLVVTPSKTTDAHSRASVGLPLSASESFEVRGAHNVSLRARLQNAADVDGKVAGDYVLYANAYGAGNHVLHRAMATGVEDFISFDQRPAAPVVTYDVELTPEVHGLRLIANTLELLNADGYPFIHVTPPSIVDSQGMTHAAELGLTGCAFDSDPRVPWERAVTAPGATDCQIEIRWDDSKVVYPALLDPAWTATGVMSVARYMHTLSRLPNGDVLAVGGFSGFASLASAEIYSREQGVWAATGSMGTVRYRHTANELVDGSILIAAGSTSNPASSETYNPSTGLWTAAGALPWPASEHTSVLLADGKVLVAGGYNGTTNARETRSALYNPTTRTWSTAGSMATARMGHSAARLSNGRVLVAGGLSQAGPTASCEIYNPSTNTWAATGSMAAARFRHASAIADTGILFVAGGEANAQLLSSTETYSPTTGLWTTRPAMAQARTSATAVTIPAGKIIVVGGYSVWPDGGSLSTTETFNPSSMTWATSSPAMIDSRGDHRVIIEKGILLAAGGRQASPLSYLNRAEVTDLNPPMPTNPPARTRPLYNAPTLYGDPCQPQASCPTINVSGFLDWAFGAAPEEDDFIRSRMTSSRYNAAVATGFCNEANASKTTNWERALMALTLLGSMRSPYAESCLEQFAVLPLPTTGTFIVHGFGPSDVPLEATRLAALEAVAVDGIVLLDTPSSDVFVQSLVSSHPSAMVRAEAVRAYIENKGPAGRAALVPFVLPNEQILLDRFENRDTPGSTFGARLQAYLTLHPQP